MGGGGFEVICNNRVDGVWVSHSVLNAERGSAIKVYIILKSSQYNCV